MKTFLKLDLQLKAFILMSIFLTVLFTSMVLIYGFKAF